MYKLKGTSGTRFASYFEGSIRNFEKRMETNIAALRKRTESRDTKVKEKAARLLKTICMAVKAFFSSILVSLMSTVSLEKSARSSRRWNSFLGMYQSYSKNFQISYRRWRS